MDTENSDNPEQDEDSVTTLRKFYAIDRAMRPAVLVKRIYVKMCGDDLVCGALLSQLVYFFSDSKEDGELRARVVKDGYRWIAKSRKDWKNDLGISIEQLDRCLKKLGDGDERLKIKGLKIVKVEHHMFAGANRILHVRLVKEPFLALFDSTLKRMEDELVFLKSVEEDNKPVYRDGF